MHRSMRLRDLIFCYNSQHERGGRIPVRKAFFAHAHTHPLFYLSLTIGTKQQSAATQIRNIPVQLPFPPTSFTYLPPQILIRNRKLIYHYELSIHLSCYLCHRKPLDVYVTATQRIYIVGLALSNATRAAKVHAWVAFRLRRCCRVINVKGRKKRGEDEMG